MTELRLRCAFSGLLVAPRYPLGRAHLGWECRTPHVPRNHCYCTGAGYRRDGAGTLLQPKNRLLPDSGKRFSGRGVFWMVFIRWSLRRFVPTATVIFAGCFDPLDGGSFAAFLVGFDVRPPVHLARRGSHNQLRQRQRERQVYLLVGGWTLASFIFFLWVPLPQAYQSQWPVHRPAELIAGIFFAIAAVGYWRKGDWKTDGFTHSLVLFLIVERWAKWFYTPFSARPLDAFTWPLTFLRFWPTAWS